MEQPIFSDIDVLLDVEATLDSIICSIEMLATSCDIVNKFIEDNKQISHLQNCKHEYITDMIDIDPEKSQMITYCIHCEHTL
jgi:hypothetical protein